MFSAFNNLLWAKIKQYMSVLVRLLQRNRTSKVYVYVCVYTYLLTYYNELAHVIMETGRCPKICSQQAGDTGIVP